MGVLALYGFSSLMTTTSDEWELVTLLARLALPPSTSMAAGAVEVWKEELAASNTVLQSDIGGREVEATTDNK